MLIVCQGAPKTLGAPINKQTHRPLIKPNPDLKSPQSKATPGGGETGPPATPWMALSEDRGIAMNKGHSDWCYMTAKGFDHRPEHSTCFTSNSRSWGRGRWARGGLRGGSSECPRGLHHTVTKRFEKQHFNFWGNVH